MRLRILYLEDNPRDAELIEQTLAKDGIQTDIRRVCTDQAFESELGQRDFDLLLFGNLQPSNAGLATLALAREKRPDLPFVFISGNIGEEAAVEALRRGATDYVLKDRLSRLALVVRRAVEECRERRKREEIERALKEKEEHIRQIEKLEAIGQLTGGIAHDFNNLLTVINGRSQLMVARLPPGDPVRKEFELIYKAGDRAAALTRQLLAFSRKQVLQPKVLDLNTIISDLARLLGRVIGENIELKLNLQPGLSHVKADPVQLEQIVMNLAINARDAMPQGGTLTLETSDIELDEAYAQRHTGVAPGRYVRMTVGDTGIGMDAATRARIFEPFFTTKSRGRGTGLGLATVYGIVKQSGGNIWVYSELGRGTTFKIYLPRIEGELSMSSRSSGGMPAIGKQETVLVAEDEEEIRALIHEILSAHGYQVLLVADGQQALKLAARHTGTLEVLLTDVVMPGLGGRELAERLTKERPGLHVVYISGYTADGIANQGVFPEGIHFIEKPFTPGSLLRKLRELLDE